MDDLHVRERTGGAWAVAALAALVGLDVALGSAVPLNGSYAIAAVLAAGLSSVRVTAVVAMVATAVSAAAGSWNENMFETDWALRLVLCAALSVTAFVLAQVRHSREAALRRMTVIADTAQRALLRAVPGQVGPLTVATRYVSATQDALVGGDLYEVAASPYGVRVLMGDVRGKGLEPVLMAGSVLGAFRRSFFDEPSLARLATELDIVVTTVAGSEDFVTCLLAEFHTDDTVTLVNLGHHEPLLVTSDRVAALVPTGDPVPPLGLGPVPQPVTVPWPRGSRMLFYTDGLVEARNSEGTFFDLVAHGSALGVGSVSDALDVLLEAARRHSGPRIEDDLALLLVEHRDGVRG